MIKGTIVFSFIAMLSKSWRLHVSPLTLSSCVHAIEPQLLASSSQISWLHVIPQMNMIFSNQPIIPKIEFKMIENYCFEDLRLKRTPNSSPSRYQFVFHNKFRPRNKRRSQAEGSKNTFAKLVSENIFLKMFSQEPNIEHPLAVICCIWIHDSCAFLYKMTQGYDNQA